MTDDLEIELTKGQAGFKGMSHCFHCQKFIEPSEDSVRIEVDYTSEWVHLFCFIDMCKTILEKAGYSTNPSKRNAH
jgi:hypothetical protein